MNIFLLVCSLIHIIYANNSEFCIRVISFERQVVHYWDPQWIRPSGQAEQLVLSIRNCYNDRGHAVITLLPEHSQQDEFAFFIGGYDNTFSGLLRNSEEIYAIYTPNITDCGYNDFWVQWSSNESWLAFGTGSTPGEETLLSYASDTQVSVAGHKLSSQGPEPSFEYLVAANQVNELRYSCRYKVTNDAYGIFLSAGNRSSIVFQLLTFGDAFICLSDLPVTNTFCGSGYKIQLGAEGNSDVTIGHDEEFRVLAETPGVLSRVPRFNTYWLSWDLIESRRRTQEVESIAFGSADSQYADWILTP